jgi:hypothetical protein
VCIESWRVSLSGVRCLLDGGFLASDREGAARVDSRCAGPTTCPQSAQSGALTSAAEMHPVASKQDGEPL